MGFKYIDLIFAKLYLKSFSVINGIKKMVFEYMISELYGKPQCWKMGENIGSPTLEYSQETTTKTDATCHLRGCLPKQETMCNLLHSLIIKLLKC